MKVIVYGKKTTDKLARRKAKGDDRKALENFFRNVDEKKLISCNEQWEACEDLSDLSPQLKIEGILWLLKRHSVMTANGANGDWLAWYYIQKTVGRKDLTFTAKQMSEFMEVVEKSNERMIDMAFPPTFYVKLFKTFEKSGELIDGKIRKGFELFAKKLKEEGGGAQQKKAGVTLSTLLKKKPKKPTPPKKASMNKKKTGSK